MASGMKRLVVNAQERAVSPDINRLQDFKAKDAAETLRYLLDVTGNDDLDAGGVIVEPNTIETPLRAEIINGLMVSPQIASLSLFITPGLLYAMAPDAAPDDSNYKFARSAGISTLGTLLMTANASGLIRIDVIECQLTDTIVETDNRDIFNTITGLFSSTSVTKARENHLTFRVRLGTPGAGFPGSVAGWLPLAVASVANGTVNNNTITFWDVRPLLNDRAYAPSALAVAKPKIVKSQIAAITLATAGGWIEAVGTPIAGVSRRLGGRLRSGGVVADAETINWSSADNQDSGFALVANRPYYLYLLTPFGLPRWARYTAAGARVPRSPRGIPVFSNRAPTADGAPNPGNPVFLPTSTGMGTQNTDSGVCVAAGYVGSGPSIGGVYGDNENGFCLYSSAANDLTTAPGFPSDPLVIPSVSVVTGLSKVDCTYTLTSATNYPPNARSLLLEFSVDLTFDGTANVDYIQSHAINTFAPNGGPQISSWVVEGHQSRKSGASITRVRCMLWVPIATVYPSAAVVNTQVIQHIFFITGGIIASVNFSFLRIWGWKF